MYVLLYVSTRHCAAESRGNERRFVEHVSLDWDSLPVELDIEGRLVEVLNDQTSST